MKEIYKKIILYSIVVIFISLFISQTIENTINGFPLAIFWACYIFMILTTIGIIFNRPNLILSQIAIMMIPSILWVVDFITALIIGKPLIGLVTNMFSNGKFYLGGMIYLYHGLIVPLSFIALIIMKPNKNEIKGYLKISFVQIGILFLLSLIIPKLHGINCFPGPEMCTNMTLQFFPFYPIIFLSILTTSILISSLITNYILRKVLK